MTARAIGTTTRHQSVSTGTNLNNNNTTTTTTTTTTVTNPATTTNANSSSTPTTSSTSAKSFSSSACSIKDFNVSTLNACLSYAFTSAAVTIMNKIVFSHAHFHYPWFTLAIQNLISVATISVAHSFGFTKSGTISYSLAKRMPMPIVFFVIFIFTNAQSLRYVNLPILTVWKSFGPMFVTLFERFYFGDSFSPSVYFSMILIVLSAFVTAINDLEYSPIGYLWALLNVLANVAYLASLRIYLRDPSISALDKTFHSNLLSIIPIISMSLLSGEFPAVINALLARSPVFKVTFFLSGLLTTGVCASAFWTISVTNGSTLSFIGGFNKVPIILLSLFLFDMRISTEGWVGVSLGVIAGILFVTAKSAQQSFSKRRIVHHHHHHHQPPHLPRTTADSEYQNDHLRGATVDELQQLSIVDTDNNKAFGVQEVGIGDRPRSRSLSPPQATR